MLPRELDCPMVDLLVDLQVPRTEDLEVVDDLVRGMARMDLGLDLVQAEEVVVEQTWLDLSVGRMARS